MKRTLLWILMFVVVATLVVQPTFADDHKHKEKEHFDNEKKKNDKKDKVKEKKEKKRVDDWDDDYEYDYGDGDSRLKENTIHEFYTEPLRDNATREEKATATLRTTAVTLFGENTVLVTIKEYNGEIYIPINQLYAYMGLRLEWFGKEKIVTLAKDHHTVYIRANKRVAFSDGQKQMLMYPATVENNLLFVPLNLILHSFDLDMKQMEDHIHLDWTVKENVA